MIIPELRNLLGDTIKVYDFDDIGVPDGADKKWRQKSTEKWLQKLLRGGNAACLLGQMVLGEILSCPSAAKIAKVNFCLLDVNNFERVQRLRKRNTYGADQNMLNWSAWLRMHHQDPQWTQQVIKDDAWEGMDFSVWDQYKNWTDKINVKILDTTGLSIQDVATEVKKFIFATQKD